MAWERIPEELVKKSWVVSGYLPSDDLGREDDVRELVSRSEQEMGSVVEKLAGEDAMMAWIHQGNDAAEHFPDEDNNVDWDLDEDECATKVAAQQRREKAAENRAGGAGAAAEAGKTKEKAATTETTKDRAAPKNNAPTTKPKGKNKKVTASAKAKKKAAVTKKTKRSNSARGKGKKAKAAGRKTVRCRGNDVEVNDSSSDEELTEGELQERRESMRAAYRTKYGIGPEYGV